MGHVDPFRYSERFDIGSANSDTAGSDLQDAAMALLNHFDTNGVTPESTPDAFVTDFQMRWNEDPANKGDQLVVDGKYGPLTYGAQRAMVGNVAQPVNGGASPAVNPPAPAPPVTPPASGSSELPWLLLLAVAGGAYFLFFRKKKSTHHHAHHGSLVEIKSNPRRRARSRNSLIV